VLFGILHCSVPSLHLYCNAKTIFVDFCDNVIRWALSEEMMPMNATARSIATPTFLCDDDYPVAIDFSDFNRIGIGAAFIASAMLWYAIINLLI